ncbi:MAG TPA: hypothetical protein ENI27_10535 [bacterium]|nr:hypothetical protein [bacterium]
MRNEKYYISRGVLSIVFGGLVYLISDSLMVGLSSAVLVFAVFGLLSRSGRYVVLPQKGATALRRDEWTQSINQRSGRNAWVVSAITSGGLVLYYGLISPGTVPVSLLGISLLSGWVTYYISDYRLRK